MNKKYKFFITLLIFAICGSLYFVKYHSTCSIKSKPRVSIITSVYNGDEFIEGFLKDITQQTIFDECELIMINANSPGHEEKLIKDYMAKYSNIIYIKFPKDPGLYGVWNRAITMASADFIMNANLDDRSDPTALKMHVKELEANPDIDLVYSGYIITQIPNETFFNNHATSRAEPLEFSIKNMKYCLPGPRPVWRKSLHDHYGFFSEIFSSAGDYEMWIRAASLGAKFKKIPGTYTLFYNNPKGLSTDMEEKRANLRMLEGILINQKFGHLFN